MQESVTVSVGGGDAGPARAKVVGVDQLAVSQLQCQKVPVILCVEEYSVRRHCLKLKQDGETGGERRRGEKGSEERDNDQLIAAAYVPFNHYSTLFDHY